VPDGVPAWTLAGFLDRLDIWADLEKPSDDLRLLVTAWIMTRYDDPYSGVRRADGFENLWFGALIDAVELAAGEPVSMVTRDRAQATAAESLGLAVR
jgi:hypothetical protein